MLNSFFFFLSLIPIFPFRASESITNKEFRVDNNRKENREERALRAGVPMGARFKSLQPLIPGDTSHCSSATAPSSCLTSRFARAAGHRENFGDPISASCRNREEEMNWSLHVE